MDVIVDCRSEEGITIGLIDAIISIARVLSPRLDSLALHKVEGKPGRQLDVINESLADLAADEDVHNVFAWADYDIIP